MSILPESLDRYRKFFLFIIKYYNSDIVTYSSNKAMDNSFDLDDEKFDPSPEEFTKDLKDMGPTYVKLGQLLSTRPDLLPDEYLNALETLQDDIEPFSFAEVEKIVEEEIGMRISKAFEYFDSIPIASASIGQVHKAKLYNGKEVVVKVQRPGIKKQFLEDLNTLTDISEWAYNNSKTARKYNVKDIVEELRYILLNELDYVQEAQNLITLKRNLQNFKHIYIPAPVLDYSSSKVLTMDFVDGAKVTKISPLLHIENDLTALVDDLVEGYLQQVIVDGIAHADPHPGNVQITKDNKLALFDMGMIAKFGPTLQENILQLMISLSNYNGDEVTDTVIRISDFDSDKADIDGLRSQINRMVLDMRNKTAQDMQMGRLLIQMNRISAQKNILIPVEINILGKILLNMDQIIGVLAPKYNMQKTISVYINKLMQEKMLEELKPKNFLNLLLETKRLTEKLPERINKLTENLANNEFEVQVNAIDEKRFTDAFQKVANRITLGLITASLVLGAALLIQVPTSWTIFGYPGLAIILFTIAAALAFYLVFIIIIFDDNFKKKH